MLAAGSSILMSAGTVFTVLASAVVVAGGLVALMRSVWRVASTLRDNTRATSGLTQKIEELKTVMDGRLTVLESRVAALEAQR